MKKYLSFMLIFILLLTSVIPVSAENNPSPKEEVVYGILNTNGSVENLYVVNIFDGGAITDYGDYSRIRNMTTAEKLNKSGDRITINTGAGKFYYQGTLESKELPWEITIKYFLDGSEISGKDLGGKSGGLKIIVSIKQNEKQGSVFFENYALQVTISLDNNLCQNIKTDNATIAKAGNKEQLNYTVLPGTGADIAVTADVSDFEMEPILINGIKLALDIEIDTGEFTNQLKELSNAIKELDDGAGDLLGGLNELSEGMQKYIDGLKAFKDGLAQFAAGAGELNAGATSIKYGLSELTKQNDSILGGALSIQQATFDSINAQLAGTGMQLPPLTPENYSAILSAIPELADVKKQLDDVILFTQGIKGYLDGVSGLDSGAADLMAGMSEFSKNLSVTAITANELYKAGAELNAAIKGIRDGLYSYKSGTDELKNATAGLESEIDKKINEMLGAISGSNDEAISFVSDKNTNTSSVMFVLKTLSVNPPEIPEPSRVEPVKLNFWQRLLKLFGLYDG